MKAQTSSQRGFSLIELLIVVAIIGIIAAITVTYLMQAKQSARGASAVASMRLIHSCEASYRSSHGEYGDLSSLASEKFLNDPDLGTGHKSGYNFTAAADAATPNLNYAAACSPDNDPGGNLQNYFIDGTGIMRYKLGSPADVTSSAVN
jgi:prepilin-type N-terminal cleavage/methylation domain-containing protein